MSSGHDQAHGSRSESTTKETPMFGRLTSFPSSSPGMTSTPPPTTSEYPLTTLFTPDPSCLRFYVASCPYDPPGETCYAHAFAPAACMDGSGLKINRSYLSCYPSSIVNLLPVHTYSPGYFCPVGMTTVESVLVPNGTWCCPSGLTWADELCQKTTSQATLLSTNTDNCIEEQTVTVTRNINGEGAVVLTAVPILLAGRTGLMTTPTASTTSSSTLPPPSLKPTSDPQDPPSNRRSLSKTARAGIIVGSIVGAALFLLLSAFLIWRRRKAKIAKSVQFGQTSPGEPNDYTGKPELEGSKAYVYTVKPELDANAVRAELEGDLMEPHGNGIYMLKPELEGTVGAERNRGAYIRKKSELEAVSKPFASTTLYNLAELEVAVPSARDSTSVVAELDTER